MSEPTAWVRFRRWLIHKHISWHNLLQILINSFAKPELNKTGCGEQFYGAFGANYEDGLCINGWLWDLDSCDEAGGPLRHGGLDAGINCPSCNPEETWDEL